MIRLKNGAIRILYLIDYFYGFGGTERHLFQVSTGLDPEKFECLVCPLRHNARLVDAYKQAAVPLLPLQLKRIYGFQALFQITKVVREIRRRRFHILQSFNVDSDILGIFIAHLAGVPIVISSRRDMGTYRKFYHHAFFRMAHRFVDQYIAVCDAAAKQMIEGEGVLPEKIMTIYNGLDADKVTDIDFASAAAMKSRLGIADGDFVVGNISHLRPEKDHFTFLRAIAKARARIPVLKGLILGAGPNLEPCKKWIEEHGLADCVSFLGYQKNVFEHLPLMDVCCLTPVSNEGFSNAILEQMAFGKPVIATDIGGNREAVVDGVTGFIVPPRDDEAIAARIVELYQKPEIKRDMGERAQRRVRDHFSQEKMISNMEILYSNLYEKYCRSGSAQQLSLETAN